MGLDLWAVYDSKIGIKHIMPSTASTSPGGSGGSVVFLTLGATGVRKLGHELGGGAPVRIGNLCSLRLLFPVCARRVVLARAVVVAAPPPVASSEPEAILSATVPFR